MKSKDEIIEDVTGVPEDDQYLCSYGNDIVIRYMDIYAAQEVEKAKSDVCKWFKPPLANDWHFPECIDGEPHYIDNQPEFIHCPFCGRKIERI